MKELVHMNEHPYTPSRIVPNPSSGIALPVDHARLEEAMKLVARWELTVHAPTTEDFAEL